jgi:hypothetical protein
MLGILGIWVGPASAQIMVSGSPDIHVDQSGTIVAPADVSDDIEVLSPGLVDLGPLPDGADVTSYARFTETETVFSVGHTLALPGGITARPRDLVIWDGAAYRIEIEGASFGFPDGAAIDAFSISPFDSTFWLSFDTTVDLSGTIVRDADVIASSGAKAFDATAAGVPAGMDVDGVSMIPTTNDLLLSFDVGGTLGGITFADEDVLRYDPDGDTWTLVIDTSATQPNWAAADLNAFQVVPEPGGVIPLFIGAWVLVQLAGMRAEPRRLVCERS